MAKHLPAVLAVIILFLPASSTGADSRASQLFGCWEVSRIDWKPFPKPEYAQYLAVPQRMLFSDRPGVRKNTYILLPAPDVPKTIHDDNYWQFEANGGIRLTWRAAGERKGVEIILERLVEGEKAMKGIAKAAFDVKIPQKDDPVVVYWCPGR